MTQVPLSSTTVGLDELIRRAEAGEEVVLTRDGRPAAHLVPYDDRPLEEVRREAWARARAAVRAKNPPEWPDAAHAADFLYGWDGLPG